MRPLVKSILRLCRTVAATAGDTPQGYESAAPAPLRRGAWDALDLPAILAAMKWSMKLAEFAGIAVRVHATFLILVGWVALASWQAEQTVAAVVGGIAFILAIFVCIVLHEFGHALTARRYGIRTRDITLLPIGGVARLERMPEEPRQELLVAIAGPAVNVVIAAVLWIWLAATRSFVPPENLGVVAGPFLERVMIVNVFLVGFNLVPAFPMDGGRMLRAILASRMPYGRATQIAASIGQGIALLFGFAGLFLNPFLLFIALFVWIGAAQEAGMVQMRTALAGMPVEDLMLTDFERLAPEEPLSRAVQITLATSQKDFPVLQGAQLVGLVTQSDMVSGLSQGGPETRVADVMRRDVPTAHPGEMLETVFPRLQTGCSTLPVERNGQIVGLLTLDNVGEYIRFETARKRQP